jgi:uncharacterized repeat protein (TIGR01451 family)
MPNTNGRRTWRAVLAASAALLLLPAAANAATTDLSVTQVDSPDPVTVGQQVLYAIEVQNNGPDTSSGATVTQKLSGLLDYVGSDPSQGTCKQKGKSVTCDLGSLSVYEPSATVLITAKARKAGTATSVATVEVPNQDTDPVGANDSATATTRVVEASGGTAECGGRKVTIAGTPGPDTIDGTAGRDVIKSGAGKDVIRGLSNKDIVCAGRGNDVLKGGDDADVLKGGGGDDLLKGGSGDDSLRGGPGDDRCRGGSGTDTKKGC